MVAAFAWMISLGKAAFPVGVRDGRGLRRAKQEVKARMRRGRREGEADGWGALNSYGLAGIPLRSSPPPGVPEGPPGTTDVT